MAQFSSAGFNGVLGKFFVNSVATKTVVFFRPEYFNLIEECVSQIVLHRSGADPDFCTKRFEIDVDALIGKF